MSIFPKNKTFFKICTAGYCGPDDPFYIAARTIPHTDDKDKDTWFKAQRVGERKLATIMKTMAGDAELSSGKRLTNTSARKRLVQKLRDSGVEATSIAQISGHKSLQSINNYSQVNEETHRKISNILSDNGSRDNVNGSTQSRRYTGSASAAARLSDPATDLPVPVPLPPTNQFQWQHQPTINVPSLDLNVSQNLHQQNSLNLPFYGAVLNINSFHMYGGNNPQ